MGLLLSECFCLLIHGPSICLSPLRKARQEAVIQITGSHVTHKRTSLALSVDDTTPTGRHFV